VIGVARPDVEDEHVTLLSLGHRVPRALSELKVLWDLTEQGFKLGAKEALVKLETHTVARAVVLQVAHEMGRQLVKEQTVQCAGLLAVLRHLQRR